MDEFELFRAQAYSGGVQLSDKSSQYLNDSSSLLQGPPPTGGRRRRHSSVGLGQTEASSSTAATTDSPDTQQSHRVGFCHGL